MIIKSIIMISVFIAPLVILATCSISSSIAIVALYLVCGIGMSGIGMGIMHDAIHGSYSKNKTINKLLGNSLNLIGSSDEIWRLQHNVLHHSYTNIDEHDDDINAPFFLRFSPHAKKNKLHKFQHYYAWIFYGLLTLSWITIKDFGSINRYRKMGLIKTKSAYRKTLLKIVLWKLVYYSITLVVPILFSSVAPIVIIVSFLIMHFIAGLAISLVFQCAHITPENSFPTPDNDGNMENERMIHQLYTTSNFAPKSKVLHWFIGGLTNQIEHHLFPNICHVHYKKLSIIVKKTTSEFGLPYYSNKTFISAIGEHLKMLKMLGKPSLATVKK